MVNRLLWMSSLRFLVAHRWQTGLNLLGIALGVAVVVAVDLANQSARRAFALSLDKVAGPITHQVVAAAGTVDEQLFVQLRTDRGIEASAPRIEARLKIQGESFTLLGVDPISEIDIKRHGAAFSDAGFSALREQPDAVVLVTATARRLGLEPGSRIEALYRGRPLSLTLGGVFTPPDSAALEGIVFTDIANAQHLLHRRGRIDRIDLALEAGEAAILQNWLPPAYRLVDARERHRGLLSMSRAFHTNLTAMSLLAMLVGALLIYNTARFSILRRRTSLGTLRALGVTRDEVLQLLLGEALALGIVASATGALLGLVLSQQLVQLVTRTVDDLYFTLTVSSFHLSPLSLVKGIGLGLGTTLLATLLPAIAATRVPPITLQRRLESESLHHRRYRILAAAGVVLLAGGYLGSGITGGSLPASFAGLAVMAAGFCLLVPALVISGCRLLAIALAPVSGISQRLAIRGIEAGISRTGMAVAALAISLATVTGVTVMISSFRHSVDSWLGQTLQGDIYLSLPSDGQPYDGPGLTGALLKDFERIDGVAQVMSMRSFRVETDGGSIRAASTRPDRFADDSRLLDAVADASRRFRAGEGILVSEPLAYHRKLQPGDVLILYTASQGARPVSVLGVYRDYSSSQGVITLPALLLERFWPGLPVTGAAITLTGAAAPESVESALRKRLRHHPGTVELVRSGAIRERSLEIFDRTFAITQVLRLLVLIVAFTGLLSALLALQLEKSREYAILRATGMGRVHLGALVLQQTALLGLLSALFALPLGYLLADRLIHVINRRSFGWSMEQLFPFDILPQILSLALAAALLAAIYPLWRIRRQPIAAALREE